MGSDLLNQMWTIFPLNLRDSVMGRQIGNGAGGWNPLAVAVPILFNLFVLFLYVHLKNKTKLKLLKHGVIRKRDIVGIYVSLTLWLCSSLS